MLSDLAWQRGMLKDHWLWEGMAGGTGHSSAELHWWLSCNCSTGAWFWWKYVQSCTLPNLHFTELESVDLWYADCIVACSQPLLYCSASWVGLSVVLTGLSGFSLLHEVNIIGRLQYLLQWQSGCWEHGWVSGECENLSSRKMEE